MTQQIDHVPEVRNMLTAVEWFYDRLKWVNRDVYNEMTTQFEEAKQREKERMLKFANEYTDAVMGGCIKRAEQFYNEDYGE